MSVKRSNLNYMCNSHSSFYCLYSDPLNALFYASAHSILSQSKSSGRRQLKYISVTFVKAIDDVLVQAIHKDMINFANTVQELQLSLKEMSHREHDLGVDQTEFVPGPVRSARDVYAYRMDEFGNAILMQNEVWVLEHGDVPRGFEVFHRNGHGLDNRRPNLALRPIDTLRYFIEIFRTSVENLQASNILEIIVHGDKASLYKVPAPEPQVFWDTIRALQRQGMYLPQEKLPLYRAEVGRILKVDF